MNCFKTLQERSNHWKEKNDCTVKMTALVLQTSYENAWNITNKLGRKARKGLQSEIAIFPKFREMGLELTEIVTEAKTIKTLERLRIRGKYIIITRRHVLYHENGKTYDWTEGRQHRIIRIYKVTGTPIGTDPDCDTLQLDYVSNVTLATKTRTRKTGYCWKLIRTDTGATVELYKRKPTKIAESVTWGLLRLKSAPSVGLELHSIAAFGKRKEIYRNNSICR